MKFLRKQKADFSWDGITGWVYNTKEDFPNSSTVYIEVTAEHGKVKNTLSDVTYYVIDGDGEFFVGDAWFSVCKEDVITIPKNTPYDFRTKNSLMKIFGIFTPAFDSDANMK